MIVLPPHMVPGLGWDERESFADMTTGFVVLVALGTLAAIASGVALIIWAATL